MLFLRQYISLQTSRCSEILFSLPLFEELTDETVDKDECAGVLTLQAFESLYHMWLIWNTKTKDSCSIMQVLQNTTLSDTHT